MVTLSYFTGNLLRRTLLAGRLIARCGFNRSYYLASAPLPQAASGSGITVAFWGWLAWRFIAGVGCAADLGGGGERADVQRQRARNHRAPAGRLHDGPHVRGHCVHQLLVSKVPTSLMAVLPQVDRPGVDAMLPLLFTRIASPSGNLQARTPVWPMLRLPVRRVWG